jgi:hypothetical protein
MSAAGRARGLPLIKIRYADLPPGLHVRAEANGRHTIIYLLPGLTHAERRAALLRVRRSASMGHGPRLPASRVAAAVARNRITATTRNGAAAFRAHPLLLLPPVLVVASATLVYVMLSAVSITFPHAGPGQPGALAPAPGQARARPGSSTGDQGGPQAPGGQAGPGSGPASGSGSGPGSESGSPGSVPGGGVAGSGSPAPDPPDPGSSDPGSSDPGSSAPASAPPGSSPTAAASASAPSPTPTGAPAAPSPSPSPSSGVCLNLIVVGVCVS